MKEEAHEPSDVTYRMDVYLKMAIRFVLEMLTKNTAIRVLEVKWAGDGSVAQSG